VHLVVHAGEEAIHARATPIQIGRAAAHAVIPHQTLHPTPPDGLAVTLQTSVNARAAVRLPTFSMHLANALKQPCILLRTRARGAIAPRVIPAGTDAVEPAQQPHRVLLLLLDEGEDVGLGVEVNAIAFFKRSCSIFNCS
jgi:hypothetical protein